jgi:peptidoglycan hydrolase-like protein with peptidoglycan-binding domain
VSASVQLGTPPAEAGADGNGNPPPPRRPRRRLLWGAVAVGLVAAGIAAWVLTDSGGGESEADGTVATGTTEATVRDLVRTETFDGTLGYAGTRSLAAGRPGTITALAPEGATRRRGDVLYRVDQRPVVLLVGSLPAWRRLQIGTEGRDVRQLEENLKALGYDPGTVDREFDSDTEAAVEDWQADLGVEATGTVDPADILFSPGPVRIGAHPAEVGQTAQPGAAILEISSEDQVVTVDLAVSDRALVEVGDDVAVELPDQSEVAGTIAKIGSVAQATADETGATTGSTLEVTIELGEPAGGLDQAPVDVSVVTESREGVLAVPVTALVALLGGGYAVEVPDGGTGRLVAVEPGVYADGYVEIAGGELAEGDTVVVPQ